MPFRRKRLYQFLSLTRSIIILLSIWALSFLSALLSVTNMYLLRFELPFTAWSLLGMVVLLGLKEEIPIM
jgi:hypothetical protein